MGQRTPDFASTSDQAPRRGSISTTNAGQTSRTGSAWQQPRPPRQSREQDNENMVSPFLSCRPYQAEAASSEDRTVLLIIAPLLRLLKGRSTAALPIMLQLLNAGADSWLPSSRWCRKGGVTLYAKGLLHASTS